MSYKETEVTVTLPKKEYDALIDTKENFEERVQKEKKDYSEHLKGNLLYTIDGTFDIIHYEDLRYLGHYTNPNEMTLKNIYIYPEHANEFINRKLKRLKNEVVDTNNKYEKLKNHWLVKLLGL